MSIYFVCNKNRMGESFFALDGTRCIKRGTRDEAGISDLMKVAVIQQLCAAKTPAEAEAALQGFQNISEQKGLFYAIKVSDGAEAYNLAFYKSCKQTPKLSLFGSGAGKPSSIEDMERFVNPPAAKCSVM
jgi:hypothetical protein